MIKHCLRLSTIEVQPTFPEAQDSPKEFHTLPENGLQLRSNCIPISYPLAQVYKNVIYIYKTLWTS